MLSLLLQDPGVFAIVAIIFLCSLSLHEVFHGYVADRLGDPTPRLAGRLTLNPLAHLDPLGFIALVLVGFGWAKPVPINPRHFANPLTDEIQVALAGPFANLTIAVLLGIVSHLLHLNGASLSGEIIALAVQLNCTLMVFNLLPIPPLDGSRLLQAVLPAESYLMLERYGTIILLAVIFFGQGAIAHLFAVTVTPLVHLLLGTTF